MKRAPDFKAAFKIPGSILRCRWSRAFESWCIGPFLTRPSPCQSQRKWAILYHRFRVVQQGKGAPPKEWPLHHVICSSASPFLALVQVGPANHGHLNRLTATLGHDALKRGGNSARICGFLISSLKFQRQCQKLPLIARALF